MINLKQKKANFVPLTPVSFLRRSAIAFPRKLAVKDDSVSLTYSELYERCLRLSSALSQVGIGNGDTVAALMPNTHQMLEAHNGIPMCGAVLNALNIRLEVSSIAYILDHSRAKLLIADAQFMSIAEEAISLANYDVRLLVTPSDSSADHSQLSYEAFLASGYPDPTAPKIENEMSPISLGYTSGTTGRPKGVLCHHRGAYLNTLGNVVAANLNQHSRYLWTLPMFHCNGWSHTWGVSAVGGTHYCLPRIDPERIMETIVKEGITHMCAAPVVMNMLLEWTEGKDFHLPSPVRILTGGSAPPTKVILAMEELGFEVIQIFGQTETTGPSLIREWPEDWGTLEPEYRAKMKTRQGFQLITMDEAIVGKPETGEEVVRNGKEIGELMFRGNTVMIGYLNNQEETDKAMLNGWFHSGDLAVRHPDGSIELKDRAKDIIISGGENISCIEIEEVLYSHPLVRNVAVVARADEKWGEHPCAFIEISRNAGKINEKDLIEYCRQHLAGFKIPKSFIFGDLPMTETGKIQKFQLRERLQQENNFGDLEKEI